MPTVRYRTHHPDTHDIHHCNPITKGKPNDRSTTLIDSLHLTNNLSYTVAIVRGDFFRLFAHYSRTGGVDGEVNWVHHITHRTNQQLRNEIDLLLLVLCVSGLQRSNAVQMDLDLQNNGYNASKRSSRRSSSILRQDILPASSLPSVRNSSR